MILHACNSPGAACGSSGCVCRNVVGGIWADCYCLPAAVTGSKACGSNGRWRVVPPAPLQVGATASFALQWTPGDVLEIFDLAAVEPDGSLADSTVLDGPSHFVGTIVLHAIGGPDHAVEVELVSLSLTAASVTFMSQPTGPSLVQLAPGAVPIGHWNTVTGAILFESVPMWLTNALFPNGLTGHGSPSFFGDPGPVIGTMIMRPHAVFHVDSPPVLAVPAWTTASLAALAAGVIGGAAIILRRPRTSVRPRTT
ncbi:MAG: hypothetical protein KF817_12370 [Phycisphaeraceae bacterium]|nr:hypothetical protein [Phycisphaeraceae bacterium]